MVGIIKDDSKILISIIFISINSMVTGIVFSILANPSLSLVFGIWSLLPYVLFAIISCKYEIFFRTHTFENKKYKVLFLFSLVFAIIQNIVPYNTLIQSLPIKYLFSLGIQILIMIIWLRLWRLILRKTTFIREPRIKTQTSILDEMQNNYKDLTEDGKQRSRDIIMAMAWSGFGILIIVSLYIIVPIILSSGHFDQKLTLGISLSLFLLFIYANTRKNLLFHMAM
ncbi:hypothetical protein Sgly_1458 [Syntrophobotulus glycolicus DSM 8271]|uniref:Uncharacterized protein n=1 Tax=Syntrophobotulus glycolicus (strain DSM 8271 / FlGlyR) TaxID=645991 RepID=F0SWX7_SYNGF|nr:hypothetical protein Sgly_1458 [Syntrophobotulus glycolicus DSM 8271]